MCALGAHGLDLAAGIDEKNIGLESIYFHLLLLTGLERQGLHALQLVLLRHDFDRGGERSRLDQGKTISRLTARACAWRGVTCK